MLRFCLVADISTAGRSMLLALRMRVSMSAIGSVIMANQVLNSQLSGPPEGPEQGTAFELPTGFANAGNQPVAGHVAEANPANAELAVNGPRPAAQLAAHLDADLLARQHLHLDRVALMRFQLGHLLLEPGILRVGRHFFSD